VIRVVREELARSTVDACCGRSARNGPPSRRRAPAGEAAGTEVISQCRKLGELPVGSAAITAAGDLPAQFMIHIVIRSAEEPVTAAGVRRGLENGLRRLAEWGIRRVAIAPLGTGAGNLDAEEAAGIMVPLLAAAVRDAGLEVDIHVDSEYEEDVFRSRVANARGE
jgi:O-acetyl-ADP-ribose deacetylase